ncbi:helix-turn-helix transcriptional regulator [Eubacterium ramulus]|uniref:helix-turn-helix transcriptional regulator n=1 Tax=Eubacterium ramulus TaxID=39490 RepID=UPI00399B4DE4
MKIVNQLGYIRSTVREYSQEQLARISGVSRHTISEIELDKRVPELRTALLLARALRCPVEDIFFLKE